MNELPATRWRKTCCAPVLLNVLATNAEVPAAVELGSDSVRAPPAGLPVVFAWGPLKKAETRWRPMSVTPAGTLV